MAVYYSLYSQYTRYYSNLLTHYRSISRLLHDFLCQSLESVFDLLKFVITVVLEDILGWGYRSITGHHPPLAAG